MQRFQKNCLKVTCKGILSVILLVIAISFFAKLITRDISIQQTDSKINIVITGESPVEKVLKYINDKDILKANELITNQIMNDKKISKNVQDYFNNFQEKYEYINDKKNGSSINTSYFISNAFYLAEYLMQECKYNDIDAERLSEVVPYYFIKKYDQTLKKDLKLYDEYIKTFTQNNGLTNECADIICLYVKSSYINNKKNDDSLKIQLNRIAGYQKQFERELGENGIFEIQRDYLSEVYLFIEHKINRAFNVSLSFPKYDF